MLEQLSNNCAKQTKCVALNESYMDSARLDGRQWHTRLDVVMCELGLAPTKADPYLYRARQGKKFIIALVYVDNILFASQNLGWIKQIKHGLAKRFDKGPW